MKPFGHTKLPKFYLRFWLYQRTGFDSLLGVHGLIKHFSEILDTYLHIHDFLLQKYVGANRKKSNFDKEIIITIGKNEKYKLFKY